MAFVLIATMTLAASVVAIYRFNSLETVLQRLTEVSLPAVRLSHGIEAKATQVSVAAAQLGNAADGVQLFKQNEALTQDVQQLWAGLSALGTVIGQTDETDTIQSLIALMDSRIGELNRTVADRIALASRRERLVEEAADAADTVAAVLTEVLPVSMADAALAGAVQTMRIDAHVASTMVMQMPAADQPARFVDLQKRYLLVSDRLRRTVDEVVGRVSAPDPAERLRKAVGVLLRQVDPEAGALGLRGREIGAAQAIAALEESLRSAGAVMHQQVASLVRRAGQEAAEDRARSAAAIARSRVWLIVIAVASLVLASLIVWFFVLRYVVARLTELARSMRAIAQGDLAAAVPAAGPDELGDMSRALLVFRDHAGELRAAKEEAERARAEAEAASRTKSSFLANMSHELRTPLNAIIGYSEILVEDAADRGDDASVADLHKIQAAGKHLLGLINDILDLSKIEAGRMDVYLEAVYLARLVDEVKTIVEPMVVKNGNRFVIDCPPDIGALRTDLTKLKQSLINLLGNAAKFTKQGEVRLSLARVEGSDGLRRVRFAVSDTGIGMTGEQLGRLFQAFTQADSSTTRHFGGTGLGLTITRHFCTMLGGEVQVASREGEGSTFTIELPDQPARPTAAAGDAAAATPEAAAAPAGAGDITVLVVDDDPAVHDMLGAMLAKEGYRLLHASDGAQALEIMRRSPPDVVTLDVMMPKVDGWSVLGIMKSDPGLQHVPVIMLTIVDDRSLGYSLGASEFMTKPIDRSRLVGLIRKFAASRGEAVVLIVDDDPDVRAIVRQTVEGVGLTAAETVNGRAALDWLRRNEPPALILLDLMMPEMDGFEFLERFRGEAGLRDAPVVILTARTLTDEERAFLAERTILVLSKSAQPVGSLGQALAALAGRGAAVADRATHN